MKNDVVKSRGTKTTVIMHPLLITVLVTQLTGCVVLTDAPTAPDYFAANRDTGAERIDRVALVADSTPPEIEGVTLGFTHGEGAAGGATAGVLGGAGFGINEMVRCSDAICGTAVLLLLPVFMVGGAIAGGVAGGVAGDSADALAIAEARAQQMLAAGYLQTELLVRAEDYGRNNLDIEFVRLPEDKTVSLSAEERTSSSRIGKIDHILHLDLLQVSLRHSLVLRSRAQLISVQTGAVLSEDEYVYISESRDLDGWMADRAEPLAAAIDQGLRKIAEDAIDEYFLLYYPQETEQESGATPAVDADKSQQLAKDLVPHYVLAPAYPRLELDYLMRRKSNLWGFLSFAETDSTQPVFRWASFPRETDSGATLNEGHSFTDIHYELRVFNVTEAASVRTLKVPGRQIYEARDLQEPSHQIEMNLSDCTEYFWTVRAKFDLDGRTRATEWSGLFGINSGKFAFYPPWNLRRGIATFHGQIPGLRPEWFYFPFSTPCD